MKSQVWRTILAAALLLAGTPLASAADPIKLGSFLAVTGPASFLGDPELKTLLVVHRESEAEGQRQGWDQGPEDRTDPLRHRRQGPGCGRFRQTPDP